jgi:uncharacterized protein (TIGR02246 family)
MAEPPGKSNADEKAIHQASDAYCEAFSKGDINHLMSFWTADAEYIDTAGQVVRGHDKIAAYFKEELAETKGHKLKVTITALRFFKPDLVMEDGVAEVISPNGESSPGRYNAVWTKSRDKWLLARVQDLPADSDADDEEEEPGENEHLKPLAWLVGSWKCEQAAAGLVANLDCHWTKNKSFLFLEQVITVKGEEALIVTRIIGWAPVAKQIKAWTFDSSGSTSEGLATSADHKWTFKSKSVLADGRHGTSTSTLEWLDDQSFSLVLHGQTIDDQAITGESLKFVRQSRKP